VWTIGVAHVNDKVASVDDEVAEVRNGKRIISFKLRKRQVELLRRKGGKARHRGSKASRRPSQNVRHYLTSSVLTMEPLHALHLPGNQLRENVHRWLSPPDPSTNHNIACDTHNKKTASWFFQGSIFREWKSTGSLLWIHGETCASSHFSPDSL
jgi:hypothetical protein